MQTLVKRTSVGENYAGGENLDSGRYRARKLASDLFLGMRTGIRVTAGRCTVACRERGLFISDTMQKKTTLYTIDSRYHWIWHAIAPLSPCTHSENDTLEKHETLAG